MRSGARARLCLMVVWAAVAAMPTAPARAQETSDTVELIKNVPLEFGAIGLKKIGGYVYLTGTHTFAVYDVSDPADPKEVARKTLGYQWENEDVSANGKILLNSETSPRSLLHVWDITNPAAPDEIATLADGGNHTMECLDDCRWAYGSEGLIVDLRDPARPVIAGDWQEKTGLKGGSDSHDVEEVRPGLALSASLGAPWVLLDTGNPVEPRVLALGPDEPEGWIFHSIHWPNGGFA
jgi:hypothetical protein